MATGGNEQTASPLAEFGSFSVKDPAVNSTIHLCVSHNYTEEAYANKVGAIGAAAVVWQKLWSQPSEVQPVGDARDAFAGWKARLGGTLQAEPRRSRAPNLPADVKVLRVDASWDAAVGRLKEAESDGYRSVAVVGFWGDPIKKLLDHAASRQAAAAIHIWVVHDRSSLLSSWQQDLSADERYQRLPVAAVTE